MSRRDETTGRVLDGAVAAFAKAGFAGTSMEEIASAAGVSKLLLYHDFAGKRELHQSGSPEFARYAMSLQDEAVRAAERLMRDIEPDPVMRRWAAQTTVGITYQAIITWLEHGDPARDDEFFHRLLSVNRAAVKPPANR